VLASGEHGQHGGQTQREKNMAHHNAVFVCLSQVSMGSMVAKPNAKKIRRIGETVVAGFAGSAADGLVSERRALGGIL